MIALSPAMRRTAIGVTVGVALVTTVLWKPMHVPLEVELLSLFPALAYGLTAVALVLIYRTVRIINFAQIAMGTIAAQLFYEFYTRHILPYPVALLAGLAGGVLTATIVGIMAAALFFRHPRLVMTVVTITMVTFIGEISSTVNTAFHKEGEVGGVRAVIGPFPDKTFTIGVVPFRVIHLVGLVMLLGLVIGLAVFFRRTRVGTAIRASAENADRASLLGINVKLLQVGVWALVGLIASVGAITVMPIEGYQQGAAVSFVLLLLPLAAAVVARMSSMPIAFLVGSGMIILRNSVVYAYRNPIYIDIGLFVIVLVGLLLQRRVIQARAEESTSWRAVKEVRVTPREMLGVPAIARARVVIFALLILVALLMPWISSVSTIFSLGLVWTFAMIALSVVVLTGWSGQISLGQFALVAVGSFIGGSLTLKAHVPFILALPIAGLAGAAFAAVIGLPALRIRGLFLAVVTFALAVAAPVVIFEKSLLGKWVPEANVGRPKLFFLNFTDERSMYYLALIMFLLALGVVQSLRKSRAGRVMIALRDNEAGVQSFGIDVVRTRLAAFALSGFIAAFAGAFYVSQARGMNIRAFNVDASVNIFVLTVIGGVSSPLGALLGALYFQGAGLLFPGVRALTTGVAGLVVLMAIPGGLTQVVFGLRDAVLRVVALRQRIIVPSLFADYSPEAWERRLAPLAPPYQTQGLAALKPDQRYRLASKIFGRAPA
jgi:ABC-type branched-subunit amino acid transport system permease subunit